MNNKFHSGFIAILGRPNVGKSTFLNRIIGQKIAIMSDKAQTTRNKIQGIYTTDDAQIVFIDTPGIHKPQSRLGDFMVESALSTLNEVDAVIFMVNAEQKRGRGDDFIIERLKNGISLINELRVAYNGTPSAPPPHQPKNLGGCGEGVPSPLPRLTTPISPPKKENACSTS